MWNKSEISSSVSLFPMKNLTQSKFYSNLFKSDLD